MITLRVGIIGCGGIAVGKHLPALKKISQVELVAFCDVVKNNAEKAAVEYGICGAAVYTDYQKMIDSEKLDLVHILTPNRSHCEIAVYAMENRLHVMCEKPMAKTVADAERMLDCAKRTGMKLTIGYQNRFRADSKFLHSACVNGDLGEIYFAKAHALRRRAVPIWGVFLNAEEQGGGPLIDIGTHALDLTLWMMNNYKPKSVMGNVYRKLSDQRETGNAWGDWNPEKYTVEDSAFGFITMKNGATVILESSWALNTLDVDEAKTSLCGTKAGADMKDGIRINKIEYNKQVIVKVNSNADGVAFYDGATESSGEVEARQWIDSIINNKQPLVKPEEAFVVTQILEAIYKSSSTGEPVYF